MPGLRIPSFLAGIIPVFVVLVVGGVLAGSLAQTTQASCSQMRVSVPMEIIRESGPWRCIEVPGFLIFTRIPDRHSLAFAEELRLLTLQFAALGSPPEAFCAPANQIPVVLKLASSAGIGGGRSTGPLEVYADELSLIYLAVLPDVVPAPGAGTAVVPLDGLLGGGMDQLGVANQSSPAERLARDAFARRMNYAHPPPPAWFQEGLMHLMGQARVLPTGLTLGRVGSSSRSVTIPPEGIFLADFAAADPWQHDALVEHSALFLRWALVMSADRRESFWTFAERAAQGPVTEALFADAFGLSFGELGVDLTDSRLRRAQTLRGIPRPAMAPAEIRVASEEEAERLLRTAEAINDRVASHNAKVAASD
jgi:hypothetical protein